MKLRGLLFISCVITIVVVSGKVTERQKRADDAGGPAEALIQQQAQLIASLSADVQILKTDLAQQKAQINTLISKNDVLTMSSGKYDCVLLYVT